MEFSINKFFLKEECNSILEYVDSVGEPFSYNPNETWDCKRIYDESFKNLNKLDTENLAKMINWLIKLPQEIEIREISVYCTTLEREFEKAGLI